MITRRHALRPLSSLLLIPFLWLWRDLSRVHQRLSPSVKRALRLARPQEGVRLHDEVILIATAGEARALSTRCPHLGCRIDRLEGEILSCPCHGSRFDLQGRRLSGPARADLRPLQVRLEGDEVVIEL